MTKFKIGIDVGGTFTDLFLWSEEGGAESFKVLSTPKDPSVGVSEGLQIMAQAHDLTLAEFAKQVSTIVHGTTVTTNAVLTRGGAKTALITTEGTRDALEMRRGIREEQYNNRYQNVKPLVPRYLRLPVTGRLDYQGQELTALDTEQLKQAIQEIKTEGVAAVAICFMNAFANPAHERAARELVQAELPESYLSVSSEVLPIVRYYNRVSSTVLNAYVGPVLASYLDNLTKNLAATGFSGVLLIMQSNGGVALPAVVRQLPASTLLSGPAAGPRAAVAITSTFGKDDCVLVDMGGTSFDASLVQGGQATLATEGDIDRLRIALPMLDITTIGAGGGSIGWIDEGGLLRMGPESAGALPGPACYDCGGTRPACTDADLVLGYLDANFFAGGKMQLNLEKARAAIGKEIAEPLGLDIDEAAAGMYRMINASMAHGVREITVKRGLDPREFPMVVAGGAGSLHACMIADELEMPLLVVPATSSILCAAGMLYSDLQHDFVRSHICPLGQLDPDTLRGLIDKMSAEGQSQLRQEGMAEDQIEQRVFLDLRYLKQYHEVTLPVPLAVVESADLVAIAVAFHTEHNRLYGYDLAQEGTDLELINVRVRSLGHTAKPELPRLEIGDSDPGPALKGQRRAYVPEKESFAEIPVFDGHRLRAGNEISGPALIERVNTTTFISAGFDARVDEFGSVLLRARSTAGGAQ